MIVVEHLAKRFRVPKSKPLSSCKRQDPRLDGHYFYSVRDVSFQTRSGEVLGLLGPNGAGKTTVLRMLSGVLTPDRGRIEIGGQDWQHQPEQMRHQIGFLSASTSLYQRFTVEENLHYFGVLYGLSEAKVAQRISELSEQLELEPFLQRKVGELSLGMNQRASIARAVIHQPDVVILDEPTTGLDIMSAQAVLDFIDSQKTQSRPVIFSTHRLEEVSLLCDRVAIILYGHCVFEGTLEEFAGSRDTEALRMAFVERQKRAQAEVEG